MGGNHSSYALARSLVSSHLKFGTLRCFLGRNISAEGHSLHIDQMLSQCLNIDARPVRHRITPQEVCDLCDRGKRRLSRLFHTRRCVTHSVRMSMLRHCASRSGEGEDKSDEEIHKRFLSYAERRDTKLAGFSI